MFYPKIIFSLLLSIGILMGGTITYAIEDMSAESFNASDILMNNCKELDTAETVTKCLKATQNVTAIFAQDYQSRYKASAHKNTQYYPSPSGKRLSDEDVADSNIAKFCQESSNHSGNTNIKTIFESTIKKVKGCLNATKTIAVDLGKQNAAFDKTWDEQTWQVLRNHHLCLSNDNRCVSG